MFQISAGIIKPDYSSEGLTKDVEVYRHVMFLTLT